MRPYAGEVNFYERHILPHLVALVMDNPTARELRPRVVGDLRGEVLELGFGAGLNLPFYGEGTERIHIIDPDQTGRDKAAQRIADSPAQVVDAGLDGARIDLPDASMDHVVCTWTLCTIPQVEAALLEVKRVLKPGGSFRFVEHSRHPEPSVAAWQDRLNPLWMPFAGGCHLNRPIVELIRGAGLEPVSLEEFDQRSWPRIASWTALGTARKA